MFKLQMLSLSGTALALIAGCQAFPSIEYTNREEYFDAVEVEIDQQVTTGTVYITAVGLSTIDGRLVVDLVLQGPKQSVLKVARRARTALHNRPDEWIELEDPKGRSVDFVSGSERRSRQVFRTWHPPGQVGMVRRKLGNNTIRILESCGIEVDSQLLSGTYGLKFSAALSGGVVEGENFVLVTVNPSQRFELVRRSFTDQ